MCGFAGVIAWDEKYRIDRATLQRMSAAIAHRGPDGEGIYLDDQHEITPQSPLVGFAFRRLAIIDLDERSNQPFLSSDGRYVMVFNGEIYNYRELRTEISRHLPDYQWRTSGDTETLLMSYVVWKEKCVEHLNGMFAFAVWDHADKSLYIARDRMGQKPLYFAVQGEASHNRCIAFGSELRALLPCGWIDLSVSHCFLTHYLRYGWSSWLDTNRLTQLDPGEGMLVTARGQDYSSYSKHVPPEEHLVTADAGTTRHFVQQAVTRQLVSDVPLGCFLSGGIDSSVIAVSMKSTCSEIHTFSIGFDEPRYDESKYALAVAKHLGTTHHAFHVRPDAIEDLPKLARSFGEPFADSSALPTHYLARETRKHVKVALSGDGGDELFGGYDRYRAIEFASQLSALPLRHLASRSARSWARGHPKSILTRLGRFAQQLDQSLAMQYASYLRIFDDELIRDLLNAVDALPVDKIEELYARVKKTSRPAEAALATDRVTYLPDDLLTKVDRCSMLHGLEVRSPFMDHELVQFAAGLTTDLLLKGGKKRMLREAFAKDLPDFVFKRKKMGFAVPIGEWFRGELRSMLRDHLFAADGFCRQHFNMKVVERLVDEHESQRVDHSQRLYALLMLEMWWIHVARVSRT